MDVVVQMIILLIVVLVGFVAHKCNIMGGDFDKRLSAFIIDISSPCLILSSVFGDVFPDRSFIVPLLSVGFFTYVLLLGLALVITRFLGRDDVERGMFSFMVMFANVGFLGYPVASTIFGPEAVFYASLLNMPNTLFIFVFGVAFVKGGSASLKNFDWHLLFTPAMLACYVAILIVALGLDDGPRCITQPINLIGAITVPGALLIIGSSMAEIDLVAAFKSVRVYAITAIRLFFVPLIVFGFFKAVAYFIPLDPLVININTVIIGMPVASYGTMFCLRYGRDDTLMVQATMLSTLLSAISIPLLTLLF